MTVKHIQFRRPAEAAARFWSKVEKSDGCWNWTSSLTNKGYGQFQTGHGAVLAHRLSWFFLNGEVPDGLCVLHHCDNRLCVRPDHLFLGTKADNNRDMCAKGRHVGWSWKRGTSRLTPQDVEQIRSLAGQKSQKLIGEQFGISASHVWRIVHGEFSP